MQINVISATRKFYHQCKKDVVDFIFPSTCAVCKIILPEGIAHICLICEADFRVTYFEMYKESSPLDEVFWGRVQIFSTFSLLYFTKQSNTQALVHEIKYQNQKGLALYLGKSMGKKLQIKWSEGMPDCLLPVPLHPKKKNKRGYNQSELLAHGISSFLALPVVTDVLLRNKNTQTQTKKSKMERWDNVRQIFTIQQAEKWKNKHLCIVDDVITTGSTIESCVKILQQTIEGCRISVVSLAFAK
jgi:ComF family protein